MIANLPIIIKAETKEDYLSATLFVLPHEQTCCSLMRKILNREDCIYLIQRKKTVVGVFFFTEDDTFQMCLPKVGRHTIRVLTAFLKDKKLFCVSGASKYVQFIEEIAKEMPQTLWEKRSYMLMKYTPSSVPKSNFPLPTPMEIVKCTENDLEDIFPLHTAYLEEEVLLPGTHINYISEKRNLEAAIENQIVVMATDGTSVFAKAQTNAIASRTIQLGGVFTQKEYRRQGIAGSLVSFIAESAAKNGISTVLFVNKKNTTAIHSYERAGFEDTKDEYTIVYYK